MCANDRSFLFFSSFLTIYSHLSRRGAFTREREMNEEKQKKSYLYNLCGEIYLKIAKVIVIHKIIKNSEYAHSQKPNALSLTSVC